MVDTKDQSNAIVYWVGILFVDTVDTKDQSNAIVYWVGILFVDTVDMKIKVCNAFNAMFVNTVEIGPSNSTTSIPDEPSLCRHCLYGIQIQTKPLLHPVFEIFYSKQREFMSTLSIRNPDSDKATASSGIWNFLLKTERIHVDTVDTESGFRQSHCFIRYLKFSTQNRENSCRHCRYGIRIQTKPLLHLVFALLHPVFEIFYSKQREFMSTLSIRNPDSDKATASSGVCTASSGIWNFLLKTERIHVDTVDTESRFRQSHCFIRCLHCFIRYLKFSTQNRENSCRHCRYGIRIQTKPLLHPVFALLHPVFEIFYSKQREFMSTLSIRNLDSDKATASSGIWNFLLKTERIHVDSVDTNKIPYSMHNSIALIFCIDCLDMSFNVDTVDTCMQRDKQPS